MKPILFNTEMVKAILNGRKTQTRRIVANKILNKIHKNDCYIHNGQIYGTCMCQGDPDGSGGYEVDRWEEIYTQSYSQYKVGDILYVRETFLIGEYGDYYNGEGTDDSTIIEQYSTSKDVIYYADAIDIVDYYSLYGEDKPIWKPSIHMPKEYARIFLKVTNVGVEKLQDILVGDIIAEGYCNPDCTNHSNPHYFSNMAKKWWANLWNSTAKDGYKWEDNPYVFVYEFKRIEKQ